ncbi:phytanoyl-CoA dioxygenase family protein [Mucilaginibacter boryungensis]|uniref:Phytanoyl-CoA dioxygenase family protein n=1 Tax=Mucilaginibacter boryungensis TaxID=768480 RepID=A0ABR9XFD6_9SPHI|nr:phytanoyl-CoA dioxygenase family protein [Mucilaginibacter boryungensis]MBE9666108.1 phytanoyl-CoA dioxygenase family protein [Mucilaginibacter boryungensis]
MENKDSLKAAFEKDGFVFIPGFLSIEETETIRQNFNRVITDVLPNMPATKVFYEDKNDASTLKQVMDIHAHDNFFNTVLFDSKFKELAELLLGDKVIGKNLEYFNKPLLIGKPTPPHQDGYYFMLDPSIAVTMWMALEPADEENGCVKYVKGSHLKGMRPHGRTKTLGFSQGITDFGTDEDMQNEIAFPAKPGDLLVHHSLTIHRANGNTSANRTRKALGLIYFGESAREDVTAKKAYQDKLQQEMVANN